MSWYLQHLPPGVSLEDYFGQVAASPTPPRTKPTNAAAAPRQGESDQGSLKCCPLAEGLKVCWKTDWGRLTAAVRLDASDGSADEVRLTTVRPIGGLTVHGRPLEAELLAALDVWRRNVYLKGWVASRGRRQEIDRVLE
jgi:hypothetical protein